MSNPFDLADTAAYAAWREQKLDSAPRRIEDIVVALDDPRALTAGERAALLERCATANMAIYTSNTAGDADKEIPRGLGRQLGLAHLDSHWLTDDDAISPISVRGAEERGERKEFIPYTDKPIKWHTDGYYNIPERTVRGMVLHCVQSAASGGENQLLDHEIAYILLRDKNPDYIRALMGPKVMTIPARIDEGGAEARQEEPGPVFSITPSGDLHMRYTIRVNNVMWTDGAMGQEALAYLRDLLNSDSPYIYRGRLESGMGLVSNNVLHDRAAFTDDATHKRHYYRARYFDRLAGTGVADCYDL